MKRKQPFFKHYSSGSIWRLNILETFKASLPNVWCCITGQSRMRSWVTWDLACEVSDRPALISQVESMRPSGNITPAAEAAVISTSDSNYSSVNGTTLLTWHSNPTKDDKTHQSCAVTCLGDTAVLLSVALTSQEALCWQTSLWFAGSLDKNAFIF